MTNPEQIYNQGREWVDANPEQVRKMQLAGLGTAGLTLGTLAGLGAYNTYQQGQREEAAEEARHARNQLLLSGAFTLPAVPAGYKSLRDLQRGYVTRYVPALPSPNEPGPVVQKGRIGLTGRVAPDAMREVYVPVTEVDKIKSHFRDPYSKAFFTQRIDEALPDSWKSPEAARQALADADMDTLYKRLKARPVRAAAMMLGLGLTGKGLANMGVSATDYVDARERAGDPTLLTEALKSIAPR